ncbi:MAG: UvrD-helicase domain-containing protein [Synergistaceae bacterium]
MIDRENNGWNRNIKGLPEQIEAIRSDASLTVVSAGAGTGKTHTLSQRYAWILSSDKKCKVENILVLTFTEKAAREMRERIEKTVVEWYEKEPTLLTHLKDSIDNMQNSNISTIHAFSMKIIRESGLLLDIDPSSKIALDAREDVWWKEYSDSLNSLSYESLAIYFGENTSENILWKKRIKELLDEDNIIDILNKYGVDNLARYSQKASEQFGSRNKTPEDLWYIKNDNLIRDIIEMRIELRPVWDFWFSNIFDEDFLLLLKETNNETSDQLLQIYYKYCMFEYNDNLGFEFLSLVVNEYLKNLNKIDAKVKKVLENKLDTKLTKWRESQKSLLSITMELSQKESNLLNILNRIFALGWQCWENIKRKECLVTLNDLIKYAGNVLAETDEYVEKFKYILVDEFQDTDDVQNRILESIWKDNKNKLFLVGDLKQSIYRFRYANLKIFQKYINMAKSDESGSCYKYINLDKSFRTCGRLLQDFNTIFSYIWKDGLEPGSSMLYEPLNPPEAEEWCKERSLRDEENGIDLIISTVFKETTDLGKEKNEPIFETRFRLFKSVAKRINYLHQNSKVWDATKASYRPPKWKDFAILVPSRNLYPVIEDAFNFSNLPYVLCTSKSYFSRGEVLDLVNLISLLADMDTPINWFNWISSPLSGIDEPNVSELITLYINERNSKKICVSEFFERNYYDLWLEINLMRRNAEINGVYSILLDFVKNQRFLCYVAQRQRGQVSANILELAEIVREYQDAMGKSLSLCSSYLKYAVDTSVQREEPEIFNPEHDAVRVLTIHASKGLEYPFVILAGLEKENSIVSSLEVSCDYGTTISCLPEFLVGEDEDDGAAVSGALFNNKEKISQRYENLRLWYVAATRARDKLLLCATEKQGKSSKTVKGELDDTSSFFGAILKLEYLDQLKLNRIENDSIENEQSDHKGHNNEKSSTSTLGKDRKTVLASDKNRLGQISASVYSMIDWCPFAYRKYYRQGLPLEWEHGESNDIGGAGFGTFAHKVLFYWDFDINTLEDILFNKTNRVYKAIEKSLSPEIGEELYDDTSRKKLFELLQNYSQSAQSKEFRNLQLIKKLNRETPFRVKLSDIYLVGATDVFWEESNKIYIRDWKTTPKQSAPIDLYLSQLDFYGYAINRYKKILHEEQKLINTGLIFLREEEQDDKFYEINTDKIKEIEEKLYKYSELAINGPFEKSDKNCMNCPWSEMCKKSVNN